MFHSIADKLFSSSFFTGLMLMVTGLLLWLTRRAKPGVKGTGIEGFSRTKAFIIGIVQGLAIIPGISRSGSTISIGLLLGINRETAARYSFLLSIPAIVGAGLLSLKDGLSQTDLASCFPWLKRDICMCLHLTAGWSASWQSYSAGSWLLAPANRNPANTFLSNPIIPKVSGVSQLRNVTFV
jgi:undecaprenyl pyrophosphate phosphatase UppP